MIGNILSARRFRTAVAAYAAAAFLATAFFATVGLTLTGPAAAADHVVEIKQFKFVPSTLSVQVGDSITFINRDIAPHTATAKDKSWDTKSLRRGQSSVVNVVSGMKAEYFCRFHPHMKARLVITGSAN